MTSLLHLFRAGLLAPVLLAACSDAPPGPPPAAEVVAYTVESAPRSLNLAYSARTRGIREVEVRARVSGILERRFYQEGAFVRAGDKLFRIDPAPFAAAASAARGQLGVASARLAEAQSQRTRVAALYKQGFVSVRARDQAEADFASARAQVETARADLKRAELDLSYTDVRAPISGMTGVESRSEGSLIDATQQDSSLLTVIAQTGQLHVDFAMPEREAESLRAALRQGPVMARLLAQNAATTVGTAPITFVDTRVNADTGTVDVRATLENPGGRLSPGQFLRAELPGLVTAAGLYVPGKAVLYGADGPFVWTIDAKGMAQITPVTIGQLIETLMEIRSGLKPGDRVVTEGVLKLQPGAPVKATAVPAQGAAR